MSPNCFSSPQAPYQGFVPGLHPSPRTLGYSHQMKISDSANGVDLQGASGNNLG